ncbi:hypothetical protein AVEN_152059-1 [Araneus ventricosus]|uniref:Pre-C2HC domain-containing protein n=1 Tax=Araneus ventricosus TaxID=182803 RepID=A0A4Y2NBM3_ARAVE|nr:hypothetical protein AVEN_152059-1 [Araneus ventricosus]
MEISEITQSLEEKGYKTGRASQMKNYKEKRSLPLYLIDVQKHDNYANIYKQKQLCYLKALKEMKTLFQEFLTLLEATRLCKKATTKKEKVLIVLNALLICWLTIPSFFSTPTRQEHHTALLPSKGEGFTIWNGSSDPLNQVDFNIAWPLSLFMRSED